MPANNFYVAIDLNGQVVGVVMESEYPCTRNALSEIVSGWLLAGLTLKTMTDRALSKALLNTFRQPREAADTQQNHQETLLTPEEEGAGIPVSRAHTSNVDF